MTIHKKKTKAKAKAKKKTKSKVRKTSTTTRDRPSLGAGMAEKAAVAIEDHTKQQESVMDRIRKEGNFPPAKKNPGYRKK